MNSGSCDVRPSGGAERNSGTIGYRVSMVLLALVVAAECDGA